MKHHRSKAEASVVLVLLSFIVKVILVQPFRPCVPEGTQEKPADEGSLCFQSLKERCSRKGAAEAGTH